MLYETLTIDFVNAEMKVGVKVTAIKIKTVEDTANMVVEYLGNVIQEGDFTTSEFEEEIYNGEAKLATWKNLVGQ
jgi:hypothetical protein